jgi:RNA polymerase sigma-70 factor, ECF subfamily
MSSQGPGEAIAVDAAEIARMIEHGRAAHPDIPPPAGVDAFVAARADAARRSADPARRAADLFLAAACAAGEPAALARIDAQLPAVVRPAMARLGLPASDDDEIVQRVRVALMVADQGGARGVAGYSCRGDLRAYLRAVAVRLALRRIEREAGPSAADEDEVLAMLPAADDSPELRLLKQRCRGEIRAAFGEALAALSPRERTVLRQHHVDGLTIDQLGRLHGVHRATCARWIEAARASLLRRVRRHLRQQLGFEERELDSLIGLVRSQLDLSLSRLLPRAK